MSVDDRTRKFMAKYKIPECDVLDAGFKPKSYWAAAMQKEGKRYVYTGNPCQAGHRLRNRHSACVICQPQYIRISAHHHAKGTVYVAASKSSPYVKIGSTTGAMVARLKTLQNQSYGGVADWDVVHAQRVWEAGKIESHAQAAMQRYQVSDKIYRSDEKEASELFNCSPEEAIAAVKRAAANDRPPTSKR